MQTSNKLAFVFPGQGSQSVGMLAKFADAAIVRSTFDEASQVLGYDLWKLINDGPADDLNATERTQPAMLARERPSAGHTRRALDCLRATSRRL